MPTHKQLGLLSLETRDKIDRAMKACAHEGYAMWGFVFAQQPAMERIEGDGKDFVALETFNNAEPVHSIPLFIVKTEQALVVMRSMVPDNYDMEADREAVMRPFDKDGGETAMNAVPIPGITKPN
jgi:hypothetical protein